MSRTVATIKGKYMDRVLDIVDEPDDKENVWLAIRLSNEKDHFAGIMLNKEGIRALQDALKEVTMYDPD